jgi:DNA-binding HxlR family transcriptional regulator
MTQTQVFSANCQAQVFSVNCPSRLLFEQIADKWSMMILTVLDKGPLRFNVIKRRLEGVTQKALTQTLRRLERNGFVERRVLDGSPVAVEYEVTPLGRTLHKPLKALYGWTMEHLAEVDKARQAFDRKHPNGAASRDEVRAAARR